MSDTFIFRSEGEPESFLLLPAVQSWREAPMPTRDHDDWIDIISIGQSTPPPDTAAEADDGLPGPFVPSIADFDLG